MVEESWLIFKWGLLSSLLMCCILPYQHIMLNYVLGSVHNFFLVVLGVESGPCSCWVGTLPLEPLCQSHWNWEMFHQGKTCVECQVLSRMRKASACRSACSRPWTGRGENLCGGGADTGCQTLNKKRHPYCGDMGWALEPTLGEGGVLMWGWLNTGVRA
jgi:hypothetical protein